MLIIPLQSQGEIPRGRRFTSTYKHPRNGAAVCFLPLTDQFHPVMQQLPPGQGDVHRQQDLGRNNAQMILQVPTIGSGQQRETHSCFIISLTPILTVIPTLILTLPLKPKTNPNPYSKLYPNPILNLTLILLLNPNTSSLP